MKRFLWFLALIALLGYGIGSAVFLNFFLEPLINGSTDEIQIRYRYAYSLWPGRVLVSGLSFRLQDSNVQLYFEMPQVKVKVDLFSLLQRKFKARYVQAAELKFFLRFRKKPEEIKNVSLAALPQIPGLSLEKGPDEPSPPSSSKPWKIELRNIAIQNAKEIWFEEFRYLGRVQIKGGFYLHPKTQVEVFPAELQFFEGNLQVENQSAGESLLGVVRAEIEPFDPSRVPGLDIFNHTTGEIDLRGSFGGLEFINYYLKNVPQVRLKGGAGNGDLQLKIKKGEFISPSHFELQTNRMNLFLWNQIGEGRGKVRWEVSEKTGNTLAIHLEDYKIFPKDLPQYYVTGAACDLKFASEEKNIHLPVSSLRWDLEIPQARINNLRYWNSHIPSTMGFAFLGGEADVQLKLQANTAGKNDAAHLSVQTKKMAFLVGTKQYSGNLGMDVLLAQSNFTKGIAKSPSTVVSLSRLNQKNWNLTMTLRDTSLALNPAPALKTYARIVATDASPFLSIVEEKLSTLPRWFLKALSFEGMLAANATVSADQNALLISGIHLNSPKTSIQGWLKKGLSFHPDIRFLIQADPIAVAYESAAGKTSVRLHEAEKWFFRDDKSKTLLAE